MKVIVVLVVLAGAGLLALKLTSSSIDTSFAPGKEGQEARTAADTCTNWTEVLERVGAPRKWRDSPSNFDFVYNNRFDDTTRDLIAEKLKNGKMTDGFSFFYRFSDAHTFAVNFDWEGKFNNVQDKEGKGDLLGP